MWSSQQHDTKHGIDRNFVGTIMCCVASVDRDELDSDPLQCTAQKRAYFRSSRVRYNATYLEAFW